MRFAAAIFAAVTAEAKRANKAQATTPVTNPYLTPLAQNLLATVAVVVYVKGIIAICDGLVVDKRLSPSISRKIVHIAAGSWLVFWNLYTTAHATWRLNIFVPALFTLTLFVKGAIVRDRDDADVRTMSRTGAPYELLLGPLFFTLVMDVVGLAFFRQQVGALMMAAVGVGDGLAPMVGGRLGDKSVRYTLLGREKTLEGSAAVFVGTWAASWLFLRALGLPQIPIAERHALACVSTVVEAFSPPDVDNLLIPAAIYAAHVYYFSSGAL